MTVEVEVSSMRATI